MEQKNYLTFAHQGTREALLFWWGELDNTRGDRAALRRCHNPLEVAFTPAFHRLRARLDHFGSVNSDQIDRLALIAGVLSHVKENRAGGKEKISRAFAAQMAASSTGSDDGVKATVSGLRFRRLIQIDDDEKLYQEMIRLVRQLGGEVDIASLAQGIFWWNERTKKEWAFAYYENAPTED